MNDETPLYRQVSPSWVESDGRISSTAFEPTRKDENRLSVYNGDLISAIDSWRHYTQALGYMSVGVLDVIVSECVNAGLSAYPDPEPFPEHAVIDFNRLASRGRRKKAARRLRDLAVARGWRHKAK